MEKKLENILNTLSIEDTSKLLDNIDIPSCDDITQNKIKNLVNSKLGTSIPTKRPTSTKYSIIKIASFLLILVLPLLLFKSFLPQEVVTYITIDINPSIELGLDDKNMVISYSALNDDANKILSNNPPIKVSIDDSMNYILSRCIENGYFSSNETNYIAISTSNNDEVICNSLNDKIDTLTTKTLDENNIEVSIDKSNTTPNKREEAQSLGISSGKLNLINKLKELDPTINIEDYKNKSIKEIKREIQRLKLHDTQENIDIELPVTTPSGEVCVPQEEVIPIEPTPQVPENNNTNNTNNNCSPEQNNHQSNQQNNQGKPNRGPNRN